jgi:hypothetical protein
MAISSTAAPFFEPSAPPIILPMPTAHTDMRYYHPHRQSPLINEELPPLIGSRRSRCRSNSPEPQVPHPFASGSKRHVKPRRRSISAMPETPRSVRFDTPFSQSSLSDSESLSPFNDQADSKIPKPAGDAGRPGSGGYNLERSLAWRKDEFKRLKVSHTIAGAQPSYLKWKICRTIFPKKLKTILTTRSVINVRTQSLFKIYGRRCVPC